MRLLYSGPSDDSANVKRFEDDAIAAALTHGWRLTRLDTGGDTEPDEPGSDVLTATDAPPTTEPDPIDTTDSQEVPADDRPEDSEPITRKKKK